jgi:hypothetical protein
VQRSLVIGSLLAIWLKISLRVIGLIMGFGAGVLISAVAFRRGVRVPLGDDGAGLFPGDGRAVDVAQDVGLPGPPAGDDPGDLAARVGSMRRAAGHDSPNLGEAAGTTG